MKLNFKHTALIGGIIAASCGTQAHSQEQGVFEALQANCGKAFEGRVVKGAEDDPWRSAKLVMHIRDCSDTQIKVPLQYNEDMSRIWVFTRQPDGSLTLKHDHRHSDGSEDKVTQYGGATKAGDGGPGDTDIAFPVDAESIALFKENGLDRSIENTWHVSLRDNDFIYRLTRPPYDGTGRDFQVGFDLTKPVDLPPTAWDLVR